MTRTEIETMLYEGEGWDASLPGPIETIRFKRYRAPDGTGYAILTAQNKFSTGNTEKGIPWTGWKDFP